MKQLIQTSFVTALRNALDDNIRDQMARHPKRNAFGQYWEKVNGVYVAIDGIPPIHENLLPTEGLNHVLDVWAGGVAKPAGWYIPLYSGAVAPDATWTAANFTANATEITSQTEGYSEATRPQFVPGAAAANGSIDNIGSEAAYTIVCTTTINVNGVAFLTVNTRGGTTGKLGSAARYGSTRVLSNGDAYEVGYRTTFTST